MDAIPLPFRSIGRDAAIALAKSNWWEGLSEREIALTGFFTRELCLPFPRLHEAMEKVLGRSVWTHEFAFPELIGRELLGQISAPTFDDILNLIPAGKRLVIAIQEKPHGQ